MAFQVKKVLITDKVDPKCVDILKANGVEVEFNTALAKDKAQLIAEIPKYDGLIVRSATKVTSDVIAAAKNLKIIGRAGTGVDNIDCDAATKHGVIVMNTPGGNTLSAAEHTCTLMLACSRHVSSGTESLRAGRWERSKFMGNEVYGKTLAIVGLGRIGREVALRMQSFGMTTIGFDPLVSAEEAAEFNIEWMTPDKLWPRANYITVHTPLIPQTKNLINEEVLMKCPKGVRVVNCARGGIIDEQGLLAALNSGHCGGAGLDVFVEEPPTNQDLINHPLVVSTPHLGASTTEAQTRVAEEIAQQFVDMSAGKSLVGAINAPAVESALSPSKQPLIKAAEGLGRLASAILGTISSGTEITVVAHDEDLKSDIRCIKAAVAVGLLKSQAEKELNLVSAPNYAKEAGITISDAHEPLAANVKDAFTLEFKPSQLSLTGMVASAYPALIRMDHGFFPSGAMLMGNFIFYKSSNNPKVLGAIMGALTAAGVSIQYYGATMTEKDESWKALKVAAPVASLDVIKPHVTAVHQLTF